MKTTVRKWGNSAAIRIPVAMMQAIGLDIDQPVEVREEEWKIVIEPLHKKAYGLDDLLKGITRRNLHELVDFG